MKVLKRILGVVLMLISLLLGLLSIGGIVGAWSLSNSLTRGAVTLLSGADRILGTTEDALNRLESRVGTARDGVTSFEEAVVSTAEDFTENPVVLTALSERVDLGIGPAVSDLSDTVQSIRETLIGVQQTMEAINSLPFVSLGDNLPGGEKLNELSAGITALTEGIQEMRDGIREAKAGAAAEVVLRIGKATARVDAGLARIETSTTGMSGRVSETRSEVSAFQARVTLWLDLGAVALTLLFLWFLFVHVVIFVLGLSLLRDRNLFARWLGAPSPVPVAEPIGPVEPAEPVVPVTPAEPVAAIETPGPAEPAEPAELDEPTEPVEPAEPAEPVEPDESTQPVEPAESKSSEPEEADEAREPGELGVPVESESPEPAEAEEEASDES
jgi:hypothetical protein